MTFIKFYRWHMSHIHQHAYALFSLQSSIRSIQLVIINNMATNTRIVYSNEQYLATVWIVFFSVARVFNSMEREKKRRTLVSEQRSSILNTIFMAEKYTHTHNCPSIIIFSSSYVRITVYYINRHGYKSSVLSPISLLIVCATNVSIVIIFFSFSN